MSVKRHVDFKDVAIVADNKRPRANDERSTIKTSEIALLQKKHSMKSPTTLLAGHDGEIFTAKFHPSGLTLATAGSDRAIYLWTTRGECENYAVFKAAHSHTIQEVQFSPVGDKLFSCSADKVVIVWDCIKGCRLKKLRGHHSYVNSLSTSLGNVHLLASVGDDCTVNIWDLRSRRVAMSFEDKYQLTAVSFNKTGDQVMVGGIENTINVWDLKRRAMYYKMIGHTDTITGLSLSPDGHHILSNSMDNTLKSWDVRPFAPESNRLEKTFLGHKHGPEQNLLRCSWSPEQNMVAAGSSDGLVHAWSYNSYEKLHELPGHRSSVNEVAFSPKEQIILSCSSDKQAYLREMDYEVI